MPAGHMLKTTYSISDSCAARPQSKTTEHSPWDPSGWPALPQAGCPPQTPPCLPFADCWLLVLQLCRLRLLIEPLQVAWTLSAMAVLVKHPHEPSLRPTQRAFPILGPGLGALCQAGDRTSRCRRLGRRLGGRGSLAIQSIARANKRNKAGLLRQLLLSCGC